MKNESAMEEVKAFNAELQSLYETRPPVSKAKMTDITKRAMKSVKLYKHVVHAVEKFIHKCKAEYKVPGLYVIDSIVRQSRHQFTSERDVFAPRFQKNIKNTFLSLIKCPDEQRPKIVRVLNLWQKNAVFPVEITQMLHEVVASASNKQNESVRNGASNDVINVDDPSLASKISSLANQIKDQSKENKPTFDRKLLDFDYGEEEEDRRPSPEIHPPEPAKVDELQKIANSVLNPTMLESIQKALAAQSVTQQMLKQDGTPDLGIQMVAPSNPLLAAPFGMPIMVAHPFGVPPTNEADVPFTSLGQDEDLRNKEDSKRMRSRSPGRRRSRSPTRSRRRSRDRRRSTSADREKERERLSKGLPPLRRGYITLCSNTLWLGHLSKATTDADLEASFGEFGKILSIDLIIPRGCAYICMDRRQDAYRTILNKKYVRPRATGARIKIAWAPHKGAKNHKEFKDFWDVDQGAFFIPDDRMPPNVDIAQLEDGGMLDADSLPDSLRQRYDLLKNENTQPAVSASIPTSLPSGIPLPFGVPPFPMPPMAASGNNPLTMLGMPPLGMPPMMLQGLIRPTSAGVNLSGTTPSQVNNGQEKPQVSPGPPNGDIRMQMPSFVPQGNRGAIPPPRGPVPGMPLGAMPRPRQMIPRGPIGPMMRGAAMGPLHKGFDGVPMGPPHKGFDGGPLGPMMGVASRGPPHKGPEGGPIGPLMGRTPGCPPHQGLDRGPMGPIMGGAPRGLPHKGLDAGPGPMMGAGPIGQMLGAPRGPQGPGHDGEPLSSMMGGAPRGPLHKNLDSTPMGPMMGGPPRGPPIRGPDGGLMGPMMGGPPRGPPHKGLDGGPIDKMDLSPRFGGFGDFMARGPPVWNGPPGPNWRHGPPPGMRPDFRNPPQNFNGPPPIDVNFANAPPLGMVPRPSMGTPEKRFNEDTDSSRIERKRRSRWSDAPEGASAAPTQASSSAPTIAEQIDESGTPVADESNSPRAPGDDGFDMFVESPRKVS